MLPDYPTLKKDISETLKIMFGEFANRQVIASGAGTTHEAI